MFGDGGAAIDAATASPIRSASAVATAFSMCCVSTPSCTSRATVRSTTASTASSDATGGTAARDTNERRASARPAPGGGT